MGHDHILACQWNVTEMYMTDVDEFGIMLSRPKVCIINKISLTHNTSIDTAIKLYASTKSKSRYTPTNLSN